MKVKKEKITKKTKKIHLPKLKKPTPGFWIRFGITAATLGFITYIVIRLVMVAQAVQPPFDYYEYVAEKQPESYVLENNSIKFELDPSTTQFKVTQKSNGHVWYSNPPELDKDPIALPNEKNNMRSPMLIKYTTQNGVDEIYDIFSNSVDRNFYTVSKEGSKIRVDYTIGQMAREYIFPLILYQSELTKWEEGLSKSDIRAMERSYHKYTTSSFKGAELNDMLSKYPKMKDEPLYLVFEDLQKYQKEQMETLFASLGYTYEDYQENKELYKEQNIKEVPAFNLSVIYSLDENGFTAEIPFSEISYRLKYPITQVSVLPYFGAGSTTDTGFILVPEGGGSIINFNNGKTKQNGYYADCYGWDYATDRKALIIETRASYPLFGVANGDSAFISVIKSGAEYGGVTAEIAGKLGSYNYARFDYRLLHSEQFEVSTRTTSAQFVFEDALPQDEVIRQSYIFIDNPSYVDMAKVYRNYLFAGSKKTQNKDVPLAVELVGAIEKKQQVFGMPKTKPYALTTYKQAAGIIEQIEQMGMKNVNYKLSGFINEGIRSTMLNKIRFIKCLGGAGGFKRLVKSVNDSSAKLYLDGSVQTQYRTDLFKGFFSYRDSARFVSDELCKLYEYSEIWYGKNDAIDPYYLLTQSLRDKCADSLSNKSLKMGLAGVSFRDNGQKLSSDFNDRHLTTRADARQAQQNKMKEINDKGLGIMINGGNDYALDYTDFITNMEFHGKEYAIIDKTVPFYQIVLHGYKNYAGSPVNLGYETDQIILESAETAAGLYYSFMHSSAKKLQETNYTEYYSSCFDVCKDDFEQSYERYNKELSVVANSLITDHEYVSDQVTKTTFDNGYEIYVNFGYSDFNTTSGQFVPQRDYRIFKAED